MAETQAMSARGGSDLSADDIPASRGTGAERPWERFFRMPPGPREVGMIAAIGGAVAVAIGIFVWAQQPSYSNVYTGLEDADQNQVLEALREAEMDVRIDRDTGAIQVPRGDVHEARMYLAGQGLPEGQGTGFEMLDEDQRFGTSQFMETARYQRALETELGRSVSSMRAVNSARVHLAIPEDSVFIRETSQPTASVVAQLHQGRRLGDEQIAAIIHMVASSVPELQEDQVSVVDQNGNLLSRERERAGNGTGEQFEYKQRVEQAYQRRIEELLTPIVGNGRVRARVNADLDFSQMESTEEIFDPDGAVLRSEQFSDEQTSGQGMAMGIPGALTNQPPGGGQINGDEDPAGFATDPLDVRSSGTRNYEIGRTVQHVTRPRGALERLSVAVLVDQPMVEGGEEGEMVREAMDAEQIDQLTGLVQDAVGFDDGRGDSINIVDAAFQETPDEAADAPEVSIWEQPWMQDLLRWGIAGIVALALLLLVVRPLIKALIAGGGGRAGADDRSLPGSGADDEPQRLTGPDVESGSISQEQLAATGPGGSEQKLEAAREMVNNDPALAANVVKTWLKDDG